MRSEDEVSALLAEAAAVAREAGETFGSFDAAQLNWKPSAEQWSVGQCFDHLLTTNAAYFPSFEQLVKGEKQITFWERLPVLPSLFGRLMIRALDPRATRKLKAPAVFRPASSDVSGDVVARFVAQQDRLSEYIKATAAHGRDLRRTIVTSPVSPLITYSLRDGYHLILLHERRHLAQARRVTEAQGFPRAA